MVMNNKILSKNDINKLISNAKQNGKKIGLCHGCFDIVHYGHIRHFEAAKNYCDILVVSITSDDYIKKKRYFKFTNEIRINQLTNQRLVDYVLLVEDESALPAIDILKPDFYFKGDEYKNLLSDSTKNIIKEKNLVEKYGGNVIFTHEDTFSTTKLGYSLKYESEAENFDLNLNIEYIDASEYNIDLKRVKELIYNINKLNILLLGETVNDEWILYNNEFISPKSKCITGIASQKIRQIGGAHNIYQICKNFGVGVKFITNYNNNLNNNILSLQLGKITKTRYCSENFQNNPIFQIQKIEKKEIDNNLKNIIIEIFSNYQNIFIADYDHGLLKQINKLVGPDIFLNNDKSKIFSFGQANSSNMLISPVGSHSHQGTTCLNLNEAKSLVGSSHGENYEILLRKLSNQYKWKEIILTLGKEGVMGIDHNNNIFKVKPIAKIINNNTNFVGSGDSFFGIYCLVRAVGGTMIESMSLGQIAASINLGKVGTEIIPTPEKLIEISKIVLMK